MEISNFRLEEGEYNKIRQVLTSLAEKTKVEAVFLINRNGQEIASHGNSREIDAVAVASLAASNLAATIGLASLIGENEFQRVYLRGRRFSMLITPAGIYALLLFVIRADKEQLLDVRNLRQAAVVLDDVLRKCSGRVQVVEEF